MFLWPTDFEKAKAFACRSDQTVNHHCIGIFQTLYFVYETYSLHYHTLQLEKHMMDTDNEDMKA